MREALLWEREDGRVRCGVCPHRCLIAKGRTGFCGARANTGGALEPLTYGLISSIAADPIEKKPVFHFFPGTQVLSMGSVGCSMRCGHCQNWSISRAGLGDDPDVHELAAERVVDMARAYRCPGVAFTYNEPAIWIEYVVDVARLCRDAGLYTVMVTNGYVTTEALDLFGEVIDVWRVDVKAFDDWGYRTLCKVPSVQPVLDAAVRARHHWGMHVEVVTNVVPGINDSEPSLQGIAAWIRDSLGADTPWHITRFIPYLDYAHLSATPIETLRNARRIGTGEGLSFVYLGNVSESGGEDTVCPSCGTVAVAREGHCVLAQRTREGACLRCGAALNIVE